ncbi:glycosyltransferase family 39 protein [Actinomadura sp. 9N215]|uniref:glycosyltransferase family 39 protein n=1 Tax=Actinomadura sp. 9N215 TaxID=3375150 RepID=UPI0037924504
MVGTANRPEEDADTARRAWWRAGPVMPFVPAVVTLAIALTGIRGPSFWLDEAATVTMTGRPAGEMLRVFEHLDLVHALYYLVLRPWVVVFGTGELALRLPSALAAAAAAAGVAVIGRRFAGPVAGLLAGLMYGGSVPVIRFAQEARSYAMVAAVAVLATYLLLRGMQEGGRHPWRWFSGYAVSIVILGLLNLDAVCLVPAHAVTLLVARPLPARTWLRWLVGTGVAGAALVPFALAAQDQKFQVEWLPEPRLRTVWTLMQFLAGGKWLVVPVFALAIAGAAAGWSSRGTAAAASPHETASRETASRETASRGSLTAVALPWLVLPPALLLIVSVVAEPMFMYRYVVFCLPALALLTGAGLARLASLGRPAIGGALLVAALVVLAVPSVPEHAAARRQDSRPDDLRAPAEIVRTHGRDGDVIVYLAGVVRWDAAAYPDAFARLRDINQGVDPVAAANLKGRDKLPRELRPPLRRATRVWVMGSRSLGPAHAPWVQRREQVIQAMGPWRMAGFWKYKGGRLTLYERTAPYRSSR